MRGAVRKMGRKRMKIVWTYSLFGMLLLTLNVQDYSSRES
jgi:hypothetical protein